MFTVQGLNNLTMHDLTIKCSSAIPQCQRHHDSNASTTNGSLGFATGFQVFLFAVGFQVFSVLVFRHVFLL